MAIAAGLVLIIFSVIVNKRLQYRKLITSDPHQNMIKQMRFLKQLTIF